ncbi:MAG: N-acetyltransferase [Rhodospirillales bacterium]|nr:N-acetyltransferase [Rhodospirillales bacterium]
MPDGREAIAIRVVDGLAEVPAGAWDACADTANPFVSHAFLAALEASGTVMPKTGWLPQHLLIEDGKGALRACAPLYLKSHSYGEYVFDWAWADASERAGRPYYPKLQAAVPFTPVTGPRLMVRPGEPEELGDVLIAGMLQLAERHDASSIHITFPTEAEWRRLRAAGLLVRIGHQFHWTNQGYNDFDDFLDALASRKRKAIRKERQAVADSGVDLRTLTGNDITEKHWDVFYRFYRDTIDRKWGPGYLNRAFFSLLHQSLGERIVLIWAEHDGRAVGGALNLIGGDTLYGRYWGCLEHYRFLHFEACYYQAIAFAIEHGLKRVEAGAQGPHKVQRGYLPVVTYSAHWIADPALRRAVARFLEEERQAEALEREDLADASPFRKDCG